MTPDGEPEPKHSDAVLLFLDLLGTAGPKSPAESAAQLKTTRKAIALARSLSTAAVTPMTGMLWFSDNVAVHAQTEASGDTEALRFIVEEAAYMQLGFASEEVLGRGAISHGLLYSGDDFLHGPALERAVELEKSRALYPRVVLDERAVRTARRALAAARMGDHATGLEDMLLVDDGVVFVNYLDPLMEDDGDPIGTALQLKQHQELIETNLERWDGIPRVHDKYRWLATYHNYCLSRSHRKPANVGVDSVRVECSRPLGAIGEFSAT